METPNSHFFWFCLDFVLFLGAMLIGIYSFQHWFPVGLAFALIQLFLSGLGLFHKLLFQSERILLASGVIALWSFLALIFTLCGLIFILPPSTVSVSGAQSLLAGGSLLGVNYLLLTQYWKGVPLLARMYRLGSVLSFGFTLSLSCRVFWNPFYEVYTSLFLFGCLLVLSLEYFFRAQLLFRSRNEIASMPQALYCAFIHIFCSEWSPLKSFFSYLNDRAGIDIRKSWAISVLRRSTEPLIFGSIFFGWMSTSLVMIDTHEHGVLEHFGVPSQVVLDSGLHLRYPWPIDVVHKVPTHRVLSMPIGHEGEEQTSNDTEAKESILWANQHSEEEYTLLLGDGRDLISADGVLHYQITDPYGYLFAEQNPEETLRAIAYRALMHETSNRTLDNALSENLIDLAKDVQFRIVEEAARNVPCLTPVDFTFTALHPPVAVAEDYQSVISAQIDQRTRIIRAESYRRSSLPSARSEQYMEIRKSHAEAVRRVAEATGEAHSFNGLYATVYSEPELYRFRRAQEALESQLKGQKIFIIDHRIEESGGTLWIQD